MIDENLRRAVLQLSIGDRLELMELLWTSMEPDEVPITEGDSVNLDISLANLLHNPHEVALWEEVMTFLRDRTR